MRAQSVLPFYEPNTKDPLEPPWGRTPQRQREELIALLAQVTSRATRSGAASDAKERSNEQPTC